MNITNFLNYIKKEFDYFYKNRVQFCKQFKLFNFLQRFIFEYYYYCRRTTSQ